MPRSLRLLLLVTFAGVLITGAACRKKPPVVPVPPPPPPPVVVAQPPPPPPPQQPPPPVVPPPPAAPTAEEIFARMSLTELNESRPLEDVYFELDKSDITAAGRTSLSKNADWMKRWGTTRVTVEGHADSRGTSEYNLALGERRAAAARDYLVSLGIATTRIATVSKGKEQPVCTDENEACWSRNRRGHFIITAK